MKTAILQHRFDNIANQTSGNIQPQSFHTNRSTHRDSEQREAAADWPRPWQGRCFRTASGQFHQPHHEQRRSGGTEPLQRCGRTFCVKQKAVKTMTVALWRGYQQQRYQPQSPRRSPRTPDRSLGLARLSEATSGGKSVGRVIWSRFVSRAGPRSRDQQQQRQQTCMQRSRRHITKGSPTVSNPGSSM